MPSALLEALCPEAAAEIIGLFDPEVATRIKEERARMRSKVQLPEGFDFA